jgi:hypothetical protein
MPRLAVAATGSRLSRARERLAGVKGRAAGIDAQGDALVAEFKRIDDRIAGSPELRWIRTRCRC